MWEGRGEKRRERRRREERREKSREERTGGGASCARITSLIPDSYSSGHSDMSLGDQLLKVLAFLTNQSHR